MIKNYFKIVWRNIWKNKRFSVTNLISLSICYEIKKIKT